jgi:Na+/H+ antiporter NhaD/arsenite permease-like protein
MDFTPPYFLIIPFIIMIGSIALCPMLVPKWWHRHYPKISVILAALVVFYYSAVINQIDMMAHIFEEYVSFIALTGALYVVCGGIRVRVYGECSPLRNTVFLGLGAVLSNLIGTTGASMLLIRTFIKMNEHRVKAFHIIFFIFIVSNCGGCLTPIGDPPLFIGYLMGIPFGWNLANLWMPWVLVNGLLLIAFYVRDRYHWVDNTPGVEVPNTYEFKGLHHLFFVAIIVGAVFVETRYFIRELIMAAAAVASFVTADKEIYAKNDFTFEPLREVGFLFLGIFMTMVPALTLLQINAVDLGLETPLQLFALTGVFSSFLDNAPTYLSFLTASMSVNGLSIHSTNEVLRFVTEHRDSLFAISIGAVFFGATTYIGNGPNFMVKTIAEKSHIHMPSFFQYIFRYTFAILVPILIIVAFVFFIF